MGMVLVVVLLFVAGLGMSPGFRVFIVKLLVFDVLFAVDVD